MPRYPDNRCALVIGNGDYQTSDVLQNPANDAREMNRKLEQLGFTTFFDTDLTYEGMRALIDGFVAYLKGRKRVETVVVHYSGHGQQLNDTNYLIPVDETRQVSLQNLIDEITPLSERRLIFLDACRNNPGADAVTRNIANSRGIDPDVVRAIEIDGKPLQGLAAVNAAANTFIAYSASPGSLAYDGDKARGLSPFTGELVRNIDSVDLPLETLMTRVKNAVQDLTGDKQTSWTSSALKDVYFFRPSSLLLLIGNAIGLAALASVAASYSLVLVEWATRTDAKSLTWVGIAVLALLTVLAFFLAALNRAYARMRGAGGNGDGSGGKWRKVFSDGMIGGVFGGAIAAVTVAVPYWYDWRHTNVFVEDPGYWFNCSSVSWREVELPVECPHLGQLMTEITIAGMFIAAILGMASMYFFGRFDRTERFGGRLIQKHRAGIAGAVLGGLIAGIVTAPIVTSYFGSFNRPFLQPLFVLPGAVISVAVIAFSIVNYSLEQFTPARLLRSAWAALLSTLVSGALLAIAVLAMVWPGYVEAIFNWANDGYYSNLEAGNTVAAFSHLAGAGLVYGAVFGPFMGLLIGLTNAYSQEK